jgi:O-acetyl-ADP-ribose deacetylase (regulator of RNase III)
MNADACHWMLKLKVMQGDITQQKVEAVVNAANQSLLGGAGVDGAIHRAAGPEVLAECRTLGGCGTGEARMTRGYKLPARYVLHTVGPVWNEALPGFVPAVRDDLLARCYRSCFALVEEHGIRSIAFPAISCGVYGYPLDRAARVALAEMKRFLEVGRDDFEQLLVVCYTADVYDAYREALQEMVPD